MNEDTLTVPVDTTAAELILAALRLDTSDAYDHPHSATPGGTMSDRDGNMTLPEFFDHVADVHADRLARGVRKIYFQHDTLTPHNVRAVWEDIPLAEVPRAGDVLGLDGFGYMGADGRWKVARVDPNGDTSYVVTMTEREDR